MTTDENKTKITILTGTYRVKGYIDLPAILNLRPALVVK